MINYKRLKYGLSEIHLSLFASQRELSCRRKTLSLK